MIYWGITHHTLNFNNIPILTLLLTLLNITIGILIAFKTPFYEKLLLSSILISLPSLICGVLLFKLSEPINLWGNSIQILFVLGCSFTLISFLFLGRSFAIFPGQRKTISNGPFLIIRHPVYLGETIMIISCLISTTNIIISLVIFILFIPSIILRIIEEERILMKDTTYKRYQNNVKYRLIPYIW